MKSALIYSHEMGRFNFGFGHPFKPERGIKAYELCDRYGLLGHPWMLVLPPEPAEYEAARNFHTEGYLKALALASQGKASLELLEHGLGTEDNPIIPGIYEWSFRAVGGTVQGLSKILAGELDYAFNLFGGFHHGAPDHAEGFCYLNDIVIAIREAQRKDRGLKIAYLDCDAHHGNGVQDAFFADPRVLTISLHETGREIYPWSGWEFEIGEGEGRGYNINIPLEPGTDDEIYRFAFDSLVSPLISSFRPDILLAQLGADTLISDPLTHLKLTNNGYRQTVEAIRSLCPRILALGGGGYDLYRTARAWTLAWATLNRLDPKDELAGLVGGMMYGPEMEVGSLYDHPYLTEGEPKVRAQKEIERVVEFLRREVFPLHGL
ncbi:MAG: acetoin utilization protein AcuC [Smithellaceae bacterium]|nr:acetoin utilization protein AcuC [Smithellaceae bacterium]